MLSKEGKEIIDNMSYEDMLYKWRHAALGDWMFQGEAGEYAAQKMKSLGSQTSQEKKVRASKSIGWEG